MADEQPIFYTRVIVHALLPAANAGEALAVLSSMIRQGIGPDEPAREHDLSIAAGAASAASDEDGIAVVNEEFLRSMVRHDRPGGLSRAWQPEDPVWPPS